MTQFLLKSSVVALACVGLLSGCENKDGAKVDNKAPTVQSGREAKGAARVGTGKSKGTTIFDAFKDNGDGIKVNRYLWTASLEVLDFLPVQSADPFTGVITTGFGRPPGGGSAYRATILISDPALDARSLNVALQSQRGPVSAETQRAVEDAILTRARQLRIRAEKF